MKIQSLQILAEKLVEKGALFETREIHSSRSGRERIIEIGETGPLNGSKNIIENSTGYYLELIRQSKFSWMLFDASLVQIWYSIRGTEIVDHRFCYIPAPFNVDLRQGGSAADLGEIIEGVSAGNPLDQARRTVLRFECDRKAHAPGHPIAHLHLNSNDCRIPMRAPISVREFIHFLFRFFYSSQIELSLVETQFDYGSTLSEAELLSFHLNWRIA